MVGDGEWLWLVSLYGEVVIKKFFWFIFIFIVYKCFVCGGFVLNDRWIFIVVYCFYDRLICIDICNIFNIIFM